MAGSYEALFSKKSTTYKSMGLKDKLGEADYKKYILDYTFESSHLLLTTKYTLGIHKKYATSNESTRLMSKEI
jgi:arsenate reductase